MSECKAMMERRRTELLEALAELEHEQWRSWALGMLDSEENLNPERVKRWLTILSCDGYKGLPEEMKDKDRQWAEQVLSIVKKHMGIR